MRILFLGDIVGRVGREAVAAHLPGLRETLKLDFVVINAENAAAGFGMTAKIAEDLYAWGADAITLGDHAFDQKEMLTYLDEDKRIVRPLNIATTAPGAGARLFDAPRGKRCWWRRRWGACSCASLSMTRFPRWRPVCGNTRWAWRRMR